MASPGSRQVSAPVEAGRNRLILPNPVSIALPDLHDIAGLPDELEDFDEFDAIAVEQMQLRITTDSRRYGKMMTIVSGFDDGNVDPKKLGKELKAKCACGGGFKDGHIELQGDHARKVQKLLEEMGFEARID